MVDIHCSIEQYIHINKLTIQSGYHYNNSMWYIHYKCIQYTKYTFVKSPLSMINSIVQTSGVRCIACALSPSITIMQYTSQWIYSHNPSRFTEDEGVFCAVVWCSVRSYGVLASLMMCWTGLWWKYCWSVKQYRMLILQTRCVMS